MNKLDKLRSYDLPTIIMIANTVIICYVFGRAFMVSLFEAGRHYVTKTSILLCIVLLAGLLGIHLASTRYSQVEKPKRLSLKLAIIFNMLYVLLAFMMLLMGALIV